jgi:hypothetical protein
MPTISCTEFSRRLAEAVESRQSVDSITLREHAAMCPECRSEWLDALLVDRAVAHWPKPVASAGLTERILAQVADVTTGAGTAGPLSAQIAPDKPSAERRTVRSARRAGWTAGVAITAAAACIGAMFYLGRPSPPTSVAQPEIAKRAPSIALASAASAKAPGGTPVKPRVPVSAGAPVELMVADAGSAYLHLAGDAAKAVTAATVLVPPADAVHESRAPQKRQEPWVDGMRREIAPVTHQLGHAFEFLIQAVPEQRAPAT